VLERPNGAFTTVRASGRVFAQTERCFEVTVPLEQTATVFTGREREASAYELLGVTLAPPGFEDCGFEDFEEIWSEEPVTLFGRELPILCRTVTRCEREEKKSTITVDRAEDLAYDKYEEYKRDTLLYGYEILEENLQIRVCEEGVTLTAELVLVEDIARSLPFLLLEKED
ncbi:MAG: sporulation protein YqfD, partial [Clostridia bacterium]|nr:sporulation protein YqfD [Clostridia bacterium]